MSQAIQPDALQVPQTPITDNTVISLQQARIYQRNALILENVNLQVQKGEFVYIVGRTGTGKSSLLRTLYGDLPLQEGQGKVVGINLKGLNWKLLPYLRRKLGIVFQDFQLLTDRSVNDNLRFALEATDWRDEREIEERIVNVLVNVGLAHKRNVMPYRLSGGEQQRIGIARCLLNDPQLILADEPTGNLDPRTSESIIALLYQISKVTNTAVVVGTHDFHVIEKFPARMLTCKDGEILPGLQI